MRPSSVETGVPRLFIPNSAEALRSKSTAQLQSMADRLANGGKSSEGRPHLKQQFNAVRRQIRERERRERKSSMLTSSGSLGQFETVHATFEDEKPDAPVNVLVVQGHFDDWIMGGALIVQLTENNANVSTATLTDGALNGNPHTRWREERKVGKKAGFRRADGLFVPDGRLEDHLDEAVEFLGDVVSKNNYDLIMAPSEKDPHRDHAAANLVAREVAGSDIPVHGMETIWSTDYNGNHWTPNLYVPVTEDQAERADELYLGYTSQTRIRTLDVLRVLNMTRFAGERIGVDHAVGYFEAINTPDNPNALGEHVIYKAS